MILAAPGVKIIVLPPPVNGLIVDPITCKPSKIYTIRFSEEPKKLIYGSEITYSAPPLSTLKADDYRDYVISLGIRVRAARRIGVPRYTCKVIYEMLWFIYLSKIGKVVNYTFKNIWLLSKKLTDELQLEDLLDVIEYCYDVLTCKAMGYKYLNFITSTLNTLTSKHLTEYLDEETRMVLRL